MSVRKIMLAAALVMPLAGCTWIDSVINPSQDTKSNILQAYTDACNAYKSTEHLAAVAINADLLTSAQVDTVAKARAVVTPICTGPLPSNLGSVVISILTNTLAIANAVGGK